jgi:hypothetical protein
MPRTEATAYVVSGFSRTLRAGAEEGVALVVTLMAIALLMALGSALVMTTMGETRIASSYRDGVEALYAADAGVERVLGDIAAVADWNTILDGTSRSTFVDGPPAGRRQVDGGAALDLTEATSVVRCGKAAACSEADLNATTEDRPWGRNNPRWQLYAYGPLAGLSPGTIDSRIYLVVWVADDPAENDDNALRDGGPPVPPGPAPNPGGGVISVRARSFAPGGVSRTLEAIVARGGGGVRIVRWHPLD